MSALCQSPIAFETLVAYWAGDLASVESESVEGHVMGCASCTATSARVAAIAEAIRAQIPPVVSGEVVAKLRARGLRVVDNPVKPGERRKVAFSADIDVLLHRLGGLDLSRAARVGVTVKVEETGDILFQTDDAPFDRQTSEVLIACQKHFSAFPPNIVFEIRSSDSSHNETVAMYTVPHVFVAP
jgi:hypothetical protein